MSTRPGQSRSPNFLPPFARPAPFPTSSNCAELGFFATRLERRAGFDRASVAERAEEMIKERLSLTFLITLKGCREASELLKLLFKFVRHRRAAVVSGGFLRAKEKAREKTKSHTPQSGEVTGAGEMRNAECAELGTRNSECGMLIGGARV